MIGLNTIIFGSDFRNVMRSVLAIGFLQAMRTSGSEYERAGMKTVVNDYFHRKNVAPKLTEIQ